MQLQVLDKTNQSSDYFFFLLQIKPVSSIVGNDRTDRLLIMGQNKVNIKNMVAGETIQQVVQRNGWPKSGGGGQKKILRK